MLGNLASVSILTHIVVAEKVLLLQMNLGGMEDREAYHVPFQKRKNYVK
jgi:hypothetical protein